MAAIAMPGMLGAAAVDFFIAINEHVEAGGAGVFAAACRWASKRSCRSAPTPLSVWPLARMDQDKEAPFARRCGVRRKGDGDGPAATGGAVT